MVDFEVLRTSLRHCAAARVGRVGGRRSCVINQAEQRRIVQTHRIVTTAFEQCGHVKPERGVAFNVGHRAKAPLDTATSCSRRIALTVNLTNGAVVGSRSQSSWCSRASTTL